MAASDAVANKATMLINRYHPVTSRKMFGGVGVFSAESGNMLALISSKDILHFKVDDSNRSDYTDADMPQFKHMPYYKVPETVLGDPEQLREWVVKSAEVAARKKPNKKKKKK